MSSMPSTGSDVGSGGVRPTGGFPNGAFTGLPAWQEALHRAMALAANQRVDKLYFSDADFAAWPLGEVAFVEHLTQWVGAQRRLTMLARHYDAMPRRHARFVQWRRTWSHLVDARVWEEEQLADSLPSLLLAPGVICVQLLDHEQLRGRSSNDAADLARACGGLDVFLQRAGAGFPASTLGL
jgi:hypothetical protein